MMNSVWPAIVVVIPLLFSLVIFISNSSYNKFKKLLAFFGSLIPLIILLLLLPLPLKNNILVTSVIRITPEIWLRFKADQISFVFGGTAAILWSMASLFSWGYMKGEKHLARYYGFLLLNLSWSLGIAMAANLITLYIFYELLSISSYPMIAQNETPEALAAAKKYIVYILLGGVLIFLGIILTYFIADTQSFLPNGILDLSMGKNNIISIFYIFIIGFGVKAAIMPLHGWVLDAHPAAPAPASALLSGVLVAAGTFGIIRIFYNVFGISLIQKLHLNIPLVYMASVTIIISSILALTQNNLKRRLAYSTVGQMSYILLGIAIVTHSGFLGGVIHIANHALMKGTLFLCAGVLIKSAHKKNISDMSGIGYKYPITMGVFALASLALIGTPPLAGFVSKWLLGLGTLEAHQPAFLIIILAGSLLCASYLLPVVYIAFFKKTEDELAHPENELEKKIQMETNRVPIEMLLPIIIGSLGVVILGILAALKYMPLTLAEMAYKTYWGVIK